MSIGCTRCGRGTTHADGLCWRHRPPKAPRETRPRPHRDPVTSSVAQAVLATDGPCVARFLPIPGECDGPTELDHVDTEGLGRRGPSCRCNLVALCRRHHRWKTEHAREARAIIHAYLDTLFRVSTSCPHRPAETA